MAPEIENPVHSDNSPYMKLRLTGKYNELLSMARSKNDLEAKYWEIAALSILGKVEEALNKSQESESKFVGDVWRFNYLENLGTIYDMKGELRKSLDSFMEAYEISKSFSNSTNSLIYSKKEVLRNLAGLYLDMGDYDKAEKFLIQVSAIDEGKEDVRVVSSVPYIFMLVYFRKKVYTEAMKFGLIAYKRFKGLGNEELLARTLSLLTRISILVDPSTTERYLRELREIYEKQQSDGPQIIKLTYDLANALYLKSSRRSRDKIKAETILEDIVSYNKSNITYTLDAIPPLIEILLVEYQSYQEQEVLDEIHNYLTIMVSMADKEHMYQYYVKSKIIDAQITAIEGKFEEATGLLQKTLELMKNKNLKYFEIEVNTAILNLKRDLREMEKLTLQNSNFIKRMEVSNIFDYLKHVQGQLENLKQN